MLRKLFKYHKSHDQTEDLLRCWESHSCPSFARSGRCGLRSLANLCSASCLIFPSPSFSALKGDDTSTHRIGLLRGLNTRIYEEHPAQYPHVKLTNSSRDRYPQGAENLRPSLSPGGTPSSLWAAGVLVMCISFLLTSIF